MTSEISDVLDRDGDDFTPSNFKETETAGLPQETRDMLGEIASRIGSIHGLKCGLNPPGIICGALYAVLERKYRLGELDPTNERYIHGCAYKLARKEARRQPRIRTTQLSIDVADHHDPWQEWQLDDSPSALMDASDLDRGVTDKRQKLKKLRDEALEKAEWAPISNKERRFWIIRWATCMALLELTEDRLPVPLRLFGCEHAPSEVANQLELELNTVYKQRSRLRIQIRKYIHILWQKLDTS